MTTKVQAFETLLAGMRADFLIELPERCDDIEAQILALGKSTGDSETFQALFRGVHSLKGSGGTHGLPVITIICHQLENLLSGNDANQLFDETFVAQALTYVDLLRQAATIANEANPDYSTIECALEQLHEQTRHNRLTGLIIETSTTMSRLYRAILAEENLQLTVVNSGLTGLEHLLRQPFQFVIIGRELVDMDGAAVAATLRATRGKNRDLPVILISNNPNNIPVDAKIRTVLPRDVYLGEKLLENIRLLRAE